MLQKIGLFFHLVWESIYFAFQALRTNLLRTTLSLLGVMVGIFSIVLVFTIVNALERSIREDMAFVGNNVIYVQKFPWIFDGNTEFKWWVYFRRPNNTIEEFKYLEKNVMEAAATCLIVARGNNTLKYKNSSIGGIVLMGVSYQYSKVRDVELVQGRYFTQQEMESARSVAIVGSDIAETLFPKESPIGKIVRIKGNSFQIIGIMKKEGANMFGDTSNDIRLIVPYGAFTKVYTMGIRGIAPSIAFKGRDDDPGQIALEGEVKSLLRAKRQLKPTEEDDFAINRTESFAKAISSLFAILETAGWIIGGFSILVGGFGIANIMFVSVKERTNIIGIQKSLGAKDYFILFQFLFEAIFLSMIGGLAGIGLVYLITAIPQDFLTLGLSWGNITTGLNVAVIVGVASGIIPAYLAARMNPVDAIRSK
ncbi:MAG: FtsX-like permease family protein [Cytophagales bacterium]|nr:MAG: FtsX-like permease family protein [Cytophagales bacterium]